MSGRGCTISVQILGAAGRGDIEELNLPVALHSPLSVLKEQLEEITGIAMNDQVLILCDLTDSERNSDRVLEEDISLRDIGIRNKSVLTLHALGLSAEKKQVMAKEAIKRFLKVEIDPEVKHLATPIRAEQANHSYNGIIFDIESNGPFEVDVISLSIAGMLGRVRIFARDCGWEKGKTVDTSPSQWWAHRESVSTVGWYLIADQTCLPSWDKPLEIKFRYPVTLLPHKRIGFYAHSGLPDDLGIQYQSYRRDETVASDEMIVVHPGVGHTGSTPFDDHHGWYRSYRGPAGIISYKGKFKGWNPYDHALFPKPLKDGVKALLMSTCKVKESGSFIKFVPNLVLYHILEYMHWDWFEEIETYFGGEAVNDEIIPETASSIASRVISWLQGATSRVIRENEDDDDDEYLFGEDEEDDEDYDEDDDDDDDDEDDDDVEEIDDDEDEKNDCAVEHGGGGGEEEEEEEEEEHQPQRVYRQVYYDDDDDAFQHHDDEENDDEQDGEVYEDV